MKWLQKRWSLVAILAVFALVFSSYWYQGQENNAKSFKFPYKQAGLTEREAAAHLLNRFTFGATPEDVDHVVKMGLEKWFTEQLQANLTDDELQNRLKEYDALNLTNTQVMEQFPRGPRVQKAAIAEGFLNKDSIDKGDKKTYKAALDSFMKMKGWREERELFRQFINQKILRAAYTNNQLQEVMTDFWFNHFNVSITKNDCAAFIPAYERDVIRPNSLGKFQDLLMATAKSPAMLLYLDNFTSAGTNDMIENKLANLNNRNKRILSPDTSKNKKGIVPAKKAGGLNENYAREIMELHTLGVDGGYTQTDVTEAARVLTGWTIYPIAEDGPAANMKAVIKRFGEDKLVENGFVHEGDFFFAMNRHDDREKTVLGKKFAAGGGYDEGVQLITMLAHHASTAKFIAKKIAVRFVSDNPPATLIDKMAKSFLKNDGDIKEVLITLASSPEFWSKTSFREKTKSPFEFAISTVRSLHADIQFPFVINDWVTKMGQKIYFYQAPTGFPDRGQYWINTGSLLSRMNFGLAVASKRIQGVKFDLAALNNHKEPESAEEALKVYSKILLPERNVDETIKRLTPVLNDPQFSQKVNNAAMKHETTMDSNDAMMANAKEPKARLNKNGNSKSIAKSMLATGDDSMLNQVVGIIIGSPEYQRK